MSNTPLMPAPSPQSAPVALPSDAALAEAILRHLAHRREAARLAAQMVAGDAR